MLSRGREASYLKIIAATFGIKIAFNNKRLSVRINHWKRLLTDKVVFRPKYATTKKGKKLNSIQLYKNISINYRCFCQI